MNFKKEDFKWCDYFLIRRDPNVGLYYFAWCNDTKDNAFPDVYFKCSTNAIKWIRKNWREAIDEKFEKEIFS